MNLSITTLAYLFLQLSPFIIISYFGLSSVFNRDIKGIIFLFGLIISLFMFYIVAAGIKSIMHSIGTPDDIINVFFGEVSCNSFNIGLNTIMNMPTNTAMLSFTFWYIMFTLIELDMKEIGVKHGMEPNKARKIWKQNFPTPFIHSNWPIISILSILIVGTIYLNSKESMGETACFNIPKQLFAFCIAGCLGIAWSVLIRKTKTPELQYFTKYKNNEKCSKASTKQFRCTIYKNGKEVGQSTGDNIFTIKD